MIDVHSHVIPGVDDGSRSMDESVELLKRLADQGFTGAVATPHYSRQSTLERLEESTSALEQEMQKHYPDFHVWPGQETRYHDGLAERLGRGEAHTINHTRYVLVEFDPYVPSKKLTLGIRVLAEGGYFPVLAHMERYPCLEDEGCMRLLRQYGCSFQMNYTSLAGGWLDREARRCRRLVLEGCIQLLGTDMHRVDWRPPETEAAMSWLRKSADGRLIRLLTEENPLRLVRGEPLARTIT